MSTNPNSPNAKTEISIEAIAEIVGNAAIECYGVVGLAPKSSRLNGIIELLKKENFVKGVFAKKTKNGIEIDLYIIVAFNVRLTEIVSEVQKKVIYVLERALDMKLKAVNVYVQGVKNL